MNNWQDLISEDAKHGVIIETENKLVGANWTFEYKDLVYEFQVIIVKYLQHVSSASISQISELFGLADSEIKSFLARLVNLGILKITMMEDEDLYGMKTDDFVLGTKNDITEKEEIFMIGEINIITETFINQSYTYYSLDDYERTRIGQLVSYQHLFNKPPNLTQIGESGYVFESAKSRVYRFDNMTHWQLINNLTEDQSLNKDELDSPIFENFNNIINKISRASDFINICTTTIDDALTIEREQSKNKRLTVSVETKSFDILDKILKHKKDNIFYLKLPLQDDPSISAIRITRVISHDYLTSLYLLILILQTSDNDVWYGELEDQVEDIKRIWTRIHSQSNETTAPSIDEILTTAVKYKQFKLAKLLRVRGDFYE